MRVEKDFKEFLSSLVSRKVKFLIVGGFAYAIYAEPRFTKDLDVYIERSEENAKRVLSAVRDFLGDSLGLKVSDLLEPRTVVQLGFPPLRIDITTHCDGITFKTAWKNKVAGQFGDIGVHFISLDDLIKNKAATGRDQDSVDVRRLLKVRDIQRSRNGRS